MVGTGRPATLVLAFDVGYFARHLVVHRLLAGTLARAFFPRGWGRPELVRALVEGNWLRTVFWTLRSAGLVWFYARG